MCSSSKHIRSNSVVDNLFLFSNALAYKSLKMTYRVVLLIVPKGAQSLPYYRENVFRVEMEKIDKVRCVQTYSLAT